MDRVKVGVIGAGYWGPNLIRNFQQLSEASLEFVCDLDTQRLDHIQKRFPGLKTTRNYLDLLDAPADSAGPSR